MCVRRLRLLCSDDAHHQPPPPKGSTGGVAAYCRYVINYDVLTINEHVDKEWWFCRTDFLEYFFSKREPDGVPKYTVRSLE